MENMEMEIFTHWYKKIGTKISGIKLHYSSENKYEDFTIQLL